MVAGAPKVNKSYGDGKIEVGFVKSNGQKGSHVEMYSNIDSLANEFQKPNYAAMHYKETSTAVKKESPKRLVSAYDKNSAKKKTSVSVAQPELAGHNLPDFQNVGQA